MSYTCLDFVYTLKQESSGFADELGMEYKKNQGWNKCSGLVHWEDPEESGGEGGGRGDRDGEYM